MENKQHKIQFIKQQPIILIVDDNVANIKVVVDCLKMHDYITIVARNGDMGIKRAKFSKPDLILMDIRMPGIDGFEACRQLKEFEQTKDIPIIFMTALDDINSKLHGFEVGGVDYITKPIQAEEVYARINTHLTLCNLQKALQKQIAELNAFSRTVAHDLKNPLGIISSSIEVLITNDDTSEEDEHMFFNLIQESAQKGVHIIDELLLLAGVHHAKVSPQIFDPLEVIEQVKFRLSGMIEEYQAELTVATDWPSAWGHAPWVEQVWVNYISNGLKYGGRPPKLELGFNHQRNGMVQFWVKDNGPGISPDTHKKLFTDFTRLDPTRVDGHGLGLSIVRRIVEKLGGQVGVDSEIGQGSRFYFTLPGTMINSDFYISVQNDG
ncbi:hybrid sensor histidine kinase/response regulator [Anaerolineales bacterium HSG6]|nr:hybrid sensor histidine kinase/response regulator [Anaerolineales bacterium HSG6]